MNAWTIYWILQLDEIRDFIAFGSFAAGFLALVTFVAGAVLTEAGADKYMENAEKKWAACKRIGTRFFVATIFFCTAQMFVPTTKTAAAMVILPAIVNNERIQHEAGELYQLAKQALANAVAPDKLEPSK